MFAFFIKKIPFKYDYLRMIYFSPQKFDRLIISNSSNIDKLSLGFNLTPEGFSSDLGATFERDLNIAQEYSTPFDLVVKKSKKISKRLIRKSKDAREIYQNQSSLYFYYCGEAVHRFSFYEGIANLNTKKIKKIPEVCLWLIQVLDENDDLCWIILSGSKDNYRNNSMKQNVRRDRSGSNTFEYFSYLLDHAHSTGNSIKKFKNPFQKNVILEESEIASYVFGSGSEIQYGEFEILFALHQHIELENPRFSSSYGDQKYHKPVKKIFYGSPFFVQKPSSS